jgi:hypothetical protein
MSNNYFKIVCYLGLSIFYTLVVESCKKKEQPSLSLNSENPCKSATEVTAEFTMGELTNGYSWGDTTITDTIFKDKNVHFVAQETDAEYTWYIGTEVLDTKEVTRFFSASFAGTDQTISLVVRKTPNTVCLPNDDGYDSVSKQLHVSNYRIEVGDSIYLGPIEGSYRVKMPHLQDSSEIFVNVSRGTMSSVFFNINNYDGQGSDCINQSRYNGSNYRQVYCKSGTSTNQCDYMRGSIHNVLNGQVEMKFTFGSNSPMSPNFYERIYYGRKL